MPPGDMSGMSDAVEANGLTFECLAEGDGDRLALCLHGFPDDAESMRPLLERLADEGYTAVAPYMRGYGPTGPAPDDDYRAATLGTDAIALADALEFEEAYLVGHDWGAVAAYAAAAQAPDRFERMATMAVPPGFAEELWNHPRQFLRSWYIWLFQFPGVAERTLRANDFALVEVLWSLWSPGWDYSGDRLETVKDSLRPEGNAEAALAYYRQFVNPAFKQVLREGPPDGLAEGTIETPGLVMAGGEDGCIGAEMFEPAGDAFAEGVDRRVVTVPDAGHFMHQERPKTVGDEVVDFFDRE